MAADPSEFQVFPDPTSLTEAAAARVAEIACDLIRRNGTFSIALSGGGTPGPMYERLAAEPYRSNVDWSKVEVWWGDERCVPPDSKESNYGLARRTMLSKLPIPPERIHRMRGEIDPQQAAIEYGRLLKERFGDGGIDLALQGLGPDGHTASLFPHTQALRETDHRCVANHVEKLHTWRLTMTAPFLNRSRIVLFLVSGSEKADALAQVRRGPRDPDRLPAQLLQSADGRLLWMVDSAAAGRSAPPARGAPGGN